MPVGESGLSGDVRRLGLRPSHPSPRAALPTRALRRESLESAGETGLDALFALRCRGRESLGGRTQLGLTGGSRWSVACGVKWLGWRGEVFKDEPL